MSHGWKKYHYSHIPFGKTVQMYRTALGWSLGELGRRTGINKGTLQQIEQSGRSIPERDRIKLVKVVSEALEATNKCFDRRKFFALAGVETTAVPKQAIDPPPTERRASCLLTQYSDICLELAESHISNLQRELYQGRASFVMEEARKWYRKLTNPDLPETDIQLAAAQLRFGILLGQAQEAVYPWYQRCNIALQTYNQVEGRVISQFLLNSFQADYAMLHALRAPLYREIGKFAESVDEFNHGCDYAAQIGDLFLETTLMRNLAHLRIVQGDECKWHDGIERSRNKSSTSQQLSSLVELEYAGGYRRLAYHPMKSLSQKMRKDYAQRALGRFEYAQTICPEPWTPHTGLIGADGHPLLIAVIKAQCFVWIDPSETLRIIEELRPQVTLLFPALLAKMDFTASCAKQMLARKKNDPIPVFNLDAQYARSSKRK